MIITYKCCFFTCHKSYVRNCLDRPPLKLILVCFDLAGAGKEAVPVRGASRDQRCTQPCIISLLPHEGHKHVGKSVKGYVAICGMVMVEAKLRSLDLHRRYLDNIQHR